MKITLSQQQQQQQQHGKSLTLPLTTTATLTTAAMGSYYPMWLRIIMCFGGVYDIVSYDWFNNVSNDI